MPFAKKTWNDRLVEFAGRRKLTDVTTRAVQTVDVTRDEGNVSREGTAFSAANMNDLEQRIADCVSEMETTFQDGVDTLYNQCVSCGVTPDEKTPAAIASAIAKIYTDRYNAGVNATKVGTATAAQVLSGYTFTNVSSVGASGAMPNRGALNFNPSGSENQSVQPGYYSGGTLSSANAYNAGYNAGFRPARIISINGHTDSGDQFLRIVVRVDTSRATQLSCGALTSSAAQRCSITIRKETGTLLSETLVQAYSPNSFNVADSNWAEIDLMRRYNEDTITLSEINVQ